MIQLIRKHKLAFITLVYWVLLLYIIAALIWWFIALREQNEQMANYKKLQLNTYDSTFAEDLAKIKEHEQRKNMQYAGEGATFLLLILVGAAFVFRAVRRQIKLSSQQQNFMMAVTHELKTPITIAKLNMETLRKHSLDEDQRKKLISLSLEELDRLGTLTANILVVAQMEGSHYHLNKQEINLSALAESVAGDFNKRFPASSFIKKIEPDIFVEGDHSLLQLLLNNLIANAIKYSPQGKSISVQLSVDSERAVLDIADEGTGIPDEEKKNIFEKFYRIGNETTRSAKGTGLGLYLCNRIVKDHEGKIEVHNNKPTGTVFTVILNAI